MSFKVTTQSGRAFIRYDGRAETRAIKEAQRQQDAAAVWAEVVARQQAVEERTEPAKGGATGASDD